MNLIRSHGDILPQAKRSTLLVKNVSTMEWTKEKIMLPATFSVVVMTGGREPWRVSLSLARSTTRRTNIAHWYQYDWVGGSGAAERGW